MAFTLGDLPIIAVAIVVGVIVLGFGAKILDQIDDDMTGTSASIVANGTSALDKVGKQLPTLGLVIVAALIIGIVATSFYMGKRS